MAEAVIKIRPEGFEQTARLLRQTTREMNSQEREVKRVSLAYERLSKIQEHQRKQAALAKFAESQRGPTDWQRFSSTFGNLKTLVIGSAVAAGTVRVARFLGEAADEGERLSGSVRGFAMMAKSRGMPEAVLRLREYSRALGDSADMATVAGTATRLLATNSKLSADQIGKLFTYARSWARSTGSEVIPTVENLGNAMAGMELETLRRLGLEVDFKKAVEDYAKANRKKIDTIDEETKRMIKLNEVMRAVDKNQRAIGVPGRSTAENLRAISSSWTDIKAGFGRAIEPVAEPVTREVANVLRGDTSGVLGTLVDLVSFGGGSNASRYVDKAEKAFYNSERDKQRLQGR